MRSLLFLLLPGLLAISACDSQQQETVPDTVSQLAESVNNDAAKGMPRSEAILLDFVERETGIEPYRVRMLVTKDHLRMDEGLDSDNFLLFDRQSRDVFSVTHHDQRILKIPFRNNLNQVTASIEFATQEKSSKDMPEFAGQQPKHLSFTANGKTCFEVIASQNALQDVVDAIRGYLLTLAGEQIVNLNKTPVEFRTDCMMNNLIYKPVQHLDYGFPLREWDDKGYVRELMNYRTEAVDSGLFILNPSYQFVQLGADGLTVSP